MRLLTPALAAALAGGIVVLSAPAAYASHASFDCRLVAVAEESVLTGDADTYTGYAAGYVIGGQSESVSIRCYVAVDGNDVTGANTVPGTGNTTAITAGQVTFTANDSQTVEICAEAFAYSHTETTCFPTTRETTTVDGNTLVEGVLDVVELQLGPILCPILMAVDDIVDVRGAIDIDDFDGDLTVLGILVLDCPPRDPPGGGHGLPVRTVKVIRS